MSFFKERYETVTNEEPVYGKEWIVDQEAWEEEVLTGYKCRVCGDKKSN